MEKLLLLLLFCHVSSPVKHTLKYINTATSGLPGLPEFFSTAMVDGNLVAYCDNSKKIIELKHDWVKKVLDNDRAQLEDYNWGCFKWLPFFFNDTMNSLKQRFNQSGGAHILQRMNGCEWDDETGEVNGYYKYGYDGEDFISIDLKEKEWIAPKPQAFNTKLRWDADRAEINKIHHFLTVIYRDWLKTYVDYGRDSLQRTELPSVSLLQKTPSSRVSCHATGFYPDRASLFWRKDGKKLQVDHGEILPNLDGTFQMRVDLNLSSVTPEDWTRYDCVFQFSDVKEDIITRLEKDRIRTNWVEPISLTVPVAAAVVVLALILIGAAGFIVYKKKKGERQKASDNNEVL